MIEILLILALIATVSSLVILNANSLLAGLGSRPLPELLRQSVREARFQAAYNKEIAILRFDHEQGAFIISTGTQAEVYRVEGGNARDVRVEFFQLIPAQGTGNPDFSRREPIGQIYFHPDRSSTPFAVRMRFDNQTVEQRFDPFSDLIVEETR